MMNRLFWTLFQFAIGILFFQFLEHTLGDKKEKQELREKYREKQKKKKQEKKEKM